MRKLFVTAAAVATLLSIGVLTTRSDAMTPGTPAGLHATIKTTGAVKPVRWTRHHSWWARHHRYFGHYGMRQHFHRHVR
jgi:hypothetical protein